MPDGMVTGTEQFLNGGKPLPLGREENMLEPYIPAQLISLADAGLQTSKGSGGLWFTVHLGSPVWLG